MTYLTEEQITLLLKPIHPQRVLQLKGLSYVEGFDIRAELNRVFGFLRWSEETLDQQLVCETQGKTNAGKDAWYVVYRTRKRLTVCACDGTVLASYDGAHVGESTHPVRGEAHGNALTNSETYALRRCAINLGDQFGLSLYNKGSLEPVVRWTLVHPGAAQAADTDDVVQVSAEQPPFPSAEPGDARTLPASASQRRRIQATTTLEEQIRAAVTLEELREAWKRAGAEGKLQDKAPLTEQELTADGGEVLTCQEWLYRRSDEIQFPKSAGSPPPAAGQGMEGP